MKAGGRGNGKGNEWGKFKIPNSKLKTGSGESTNTGRERDFHFTEWSGEKLILGTSGRSWNWACFSPVELASVGFNATLSPPCRR